MSYFEILYKKYNKLLLTKIELAKELGWSSATLNRKLLEGEINLAYVNTGNKHFYTIKSLAKYLEAYEALAVA
jgi:hypothetical protein